MAFASCASSTSSTARVSSDGPSSIVSHTCFLLVGKRLSTGPNTREYGHSVPHQNGAWLATISGSPSVQPQRHHAAATSSCDSANSPIHACGRRGMRCRLANGLAEGDVIAA